MEIVVQIVNDKQKHKLDLSEPGTPFDALKILEIPPDTVIITKDERPIPLDTQLEPNDHIAVIRVVSGG
jgi:sulfur carrier protein ThiS